MDSGVKNIFMTSKKHNPREEGVRKNKNMHDLRGHLSVILAAVEIAILDQSSLTKDDALSVIKTTKAEVESMIDLLEKMKE